jgi:hypothetical protein
MSRWGLHSSLRGAVSSTCKRSGVCGTPRERIACRTHRLPLPRMGLEPYRWRRETTPILWRKESPLLVRHHSSPRGASRNALGRKRQPRLKASDRELPQLGGSDCLGKDAAVAMKMRATADRATAEAMIEKILMVVGDLCFGNKVDASNSVLRRRRSAPCEVKQYSFVLFRRFSAPLRRCCSV